METHSIEWNLNVEILKTTKLILELGEARKPLDHNIRILEDERRRLSSEIYHNKHRQLTIWIRRLTEQVHFVESFPDITTELAEPIHRTKIQFQHNSKNLVAERKMGRELREQERERQQQLQIQAKLMWADKIEQVSSLVVRDSKNLEMTSETREKLKDLEETGSKFRSQRHKIDKVEFAKHWISLKQIRNSILKIKYDLSRESRRHRKGNAESEGLVEEARDLRLRSYEMYDERGKLVQEERVAIKYLSKLHKLQATASP